MKIGGTDWPAASMVQHSVTFCPRSVLAIAPTCFAPVGATTFPDLHCHATGFVYVEYVFSLKRVSRVDFLQKIKELGHIYFIEAGRSSYGSRFRLTKRNMLVTLHKALKSVNSWCTLF